MGGKIHQMSSKKKGSHLLKGHSMLIIFSCQTRSTFRLNYLFSLNCRFGGRLNSIEENNKFRCTTNALDSDKQSGLKDFVSEIKNTFGLR